MTDLLYIALQSVLGYGSDNAKTVLESLNHKETFLNLPESELSSIGFSQSNIKKIHSGSLLDDAQKILNLCKEKYVCVIPYGTEKYPKKLMNIYSPPVVLYVIGDIPDFNNEVFVTIVGPRKISNYGRSVAFSLSARLSLAGVTTVSGGAVGGDSAAHNGTIAVGGKTVAVIPSGVLSDYLKTNENLRKNIVRSGGALVSEFSPEFTPHGKYSFPIRNRILSGIADAVVVAEAPEKSGTIITANDAIEQGTDVYAVPGRPNTPECFGSNKLISDGAHLLNSPKDILESFGQNPKISLIKMGDISPKELKKLYLEYYPENIELQEKPKNETKKKQKKEKPQVKSEVKKDIPPLSSDLEIIYNAVTPEGISADDLSEKLNIEISVLLSKLMMLEIKGLVRSEFGRTYFKI